MRCLLHIGVEKTGTTSIQGFLSHYREKLRDSGFLVPVLTGRGGHSVLCVACAHGFKDDDLCRYASISSEKDWSGFRRSLMDGLKREIREACDVSTLVISSEHIQSRLRTVAELEDLRDFLMEAGVSSIRILVYLRDPADIAASLYSTSVKYGSKAPGAPLPTNDYYRNVCHHQETIERFGKVFGGDAVVPRLFVPEELGEDGVVGDFCQVACMEVPDAGSFLIRRNPALSRTGIEILRRMNVEVPVFVDGRPNPLRQKLIRMMEQQYSKPSFRLDEVKRRAYDDAFADSNEWVRGRYFPDRVELFPRDVQKEAGQLIDLSDVEWDRISGLIRDSLRGEG